VPLLAPVNGENSAYLHAKQVVLKHMLGLPPKVLQA
jgi:hypothetical protein